MNNATLLLSRLEENEILFTDSIHSALWLLHDGSMIDGGFDYGMRSEDHRIIENGIEGLDRYDGDKFWNEVHLTCQAIRLCPEDNMALIRQGQQLTAIQKQILSDSNFNIEIY